jgi:hypothetical protein
MVDAGKPSQALPKSARLANPVDPFYRYQLIVNDIDNSELAHTQAVILAPVKTLRRVGI